jgi:uncharacterized membrane protein
VSEPSGAAVAALDDDHDEFDDELVPRDGILRPLKDRTLGWVLVVFGAIAFAAAGQLSIDDWKLAVNPSFHPSCSFSVFITCTAAMQSWQGKLLGFPNPFLGVAAFPIVVTVGVAMLTGFRPPRWFRALLLAGTTVGIGLVFFFVWTTIYRLGRICPYCSVVWLCMVPLFWYQLVHAVQERVVPLPDGLRAAVVRNRSIGLVVLYVALVLWVFLGLRDPIVRTLF